MARLRRLEGFDNKVIEINRAGADYPVDATLEWKNGKNVLTLTANVFYETKFLLGQLEPIPSAHPQAATDFAQRKVAVKQEFESWGRPQPYTVFKGQDVYVTIVVQEVPSASSDAVSIYLDSPTSHSMSWGGHPHPVRFLDWIPNGPKVMFLNRNDYSNARAEPFYGTARHELWNSGNRYRN